MIAFTQVFEDIATAVLLPAMNVAVGATIIAALVLIILHSTQSKSLRVDVKSCVVLFLITTVISVTASMMQSCAAEDNGPTAENEVVQMPETGKASERQELKNEVSKHKLAEELSDVIDIDSEWGSVNGRIQVTNPNRLDLRRRLLLNGGANRLFPVDVFSDDLLVDPQSGGLEGAFVYLAKAPALIHPEAAKVPVTPLICDQAAGRFEPHLMIVRVGQSVECVNTSTINMNVHNFPLKNQAVNMMIRPLTNPGAGMLWAAKREESLPMRIASDFHPWMQAYWLVLDHPYSAITDQQGRFVIENLPPGQHIVKIWHERVGYIERKLNVAIEPGKITAQPTIVIDAAKLATP